jgi:hypothetical protein
MVNNVKRKFVTTLLNYCHLEIAKLAPQVSISQLTIIHVFNLHVQIDNTKTQMMNNVNYAGIIRLSITKVMDAFRQLVTITNIIVFWAFVLHARNSRL